MADLVVKYLASTKDGKLWLSINSNVYCYHLDSAYFPWIKRRLLLNRDPGQVLNFVKKRAFHYSKEVSIIDAS